MFNSNSNTPFTMPVVPAGNAYGSGDGAFGNNGWEWIWIILIFAIFGGWGNGFGGFGGNGVNGAGLQGLATRADINEGFALNGIENGIRGIQQGLCDSTYALNNSITSGFHGVDNAICNLGYQTQQGFNQTNIALMQGQNALATQLANCCCETREAIQGVNYNMATQACDTRNTIQNTTRDIIDNQNANTRQLLDFLVNDKISTLTAENQSLKFQASQANQNAVLQAAMDANTAEIIRRTGNDCPVPAYVVPNPNCCYNPFGFGVGYGYGNNACGCA